MAKYNIGATKEPKAYVVFDLETTGLSVSRDEIIEIAAIKYVNGERAGEFHALVHPERGIDPAAARINGITEDMVKDCPNCECVVSQFADFAGKLPLVAHNGKSFDALFLGKAYERIGRTLDNRIIDTLPLARKTFPGLGHHSLEALTQYLGIKVDCRHRAMPDVEATAEVFRRCCVGRVGDKERPEEERSGKNPIYGRSIVFSGDFSLPKDQMERIATSSGAVVRSSVSTKTDFLVVGVRDFAFAQTHGELSGKHLKALEINEAGTGHIQILSEEDFFRLTKECNCNEITV